MKSLGRMTRGRVKRAVERPDHVELWCLDMAGVVEKDEGGSPVRFRRRCKNRRCCQPTDGMIAVHVWDLATGEFETVELPDKMAEDVSESAPQPAGRASRQGAQSDGTRQRR